MEEEQKQGVWKESVEKESISCVKKENDTMEGRLKAFISCSTMGKLLQTPPSYGYDVYSKKGRKKRQNRRNAMIRLQKIVEGELDKIEEACHAVREKYELRTQREGDVEDISFFATANPWTEEEIHACLRSGQEALDNAMNKIRRHIVEGDSGGDDIVAEVLLEVWQAERNICTNKCKMLTHGVNDDSFLKGGARTSRNRLESDVYHQKQNLEYEVDTREERGASISFDTDHADWLMDSRKTKHQATSHKHDIERLKQSLYSKTLALENSEREIKFLRNALHSMQSELNDSECRAGALQAALEEKYNFEESYQKAEEQIENLQSRMQSLTPRPNPLHSELRELIGEENTSFVVGIIGNTQPSPVDIQAVASELLRPPAQIDFAPTTQVPNSYTSETETFPDNASEGTDETIAKKNVEENERNTLPEIDGHSLASESSSKSEQIPSCGVGINVANPLPQILDPKTRKVSNIGVEETFYNHGNNQELELDKSNYSVHDHYAGRLYETQVTEEALCSALSRVVGSTAERYHGLEKAVASLSSENVRLSRELETYKEAERLREAARKRREEEAQLEKKNAIQSYLDLLASKGEEAWKDQLIGMGLSPDVPKIFRHTGKVRNKHLSKRDTEKLVKEIWKERVMDPAVVAGRAGDLVDFVGTHLQKKVGIAAAVIELSYNFLYGLWLFQWDADCELFLKILVGEIREEVYIAQARLCEELEELFAALDKAKGQATGQFPKEDLRIALTAFFRVGQSGGKKIERFDQLMQALDKDQPGSLVEWKKVFEEDREFNQGEFAESLRDQFLQERIDFFNELEIALYEESENTDECTREQIARAILAVDPECTESVAQNAANSSCVNGSEKTPIKVAMKKLSRGILRGSYTLRSGVQQRPFGSQRLSALQGRNSTMHSKASFGSRNSSIVPGSGANKSGPGLLTKHPPSEAINRALESVRQEWIRKQTKD